MKTEMLKPWQNNKNIAHQSVRTHQKNCMCLKGERRVKLPNYNKYSADIHRSIFNRDDAKFFTQESGPLNRKDFI